MNIPDKDEGIQLLPYLVRGTTKMLVPAGDISYSTYHPREEWGSIPENIISIDSQGVAHYVSAAFVFASATVDV